MTIAVKNSTGCCFFAFFNCHAKPRALVLKKTCNDHARKMNLSELAIHHSATVVSVSSDGSDLSNSFKDRLEAMGIRKGRTVQVMRKAPGGDPFEVRVGSTTEIAIRKSEAALVEITDVSDLKKS